MTKKELEIQMALGTLEPDKLSKKDFNYWVRIVTHRYCERQKERDAQLRAEGKLFDSEWSCGERRQ